MVKAMPSTPFQGFMATQVKRYSRATALMDSAEQASTNIKKEMIRIKIFCFFITVNINAFAKVGKFYHLAWIFALRKLNCFKKIGSWENMIFYCTRGGN